MSLQWFEGFENGMTVNGSEPLGPGGYSAGAIGSGGSNGVSTSYGRYGGSGARINSSGGAATMYWEKTTGISMGSEFTMQCASYWGSSTRDIYIMGVRQGANHLAYCYWALSSGNLIVVAGGVTVATISGLSTTRHNFIEIKVKINATTGYVIVRVDGVEVHNAANTSVTGVGTGIGDAVWIMNRYGTVNTTQLAYFDDFAFCAIDGVAPVAATGDWLGDAREVRLTPDGAGSSTQFTPLSSTNVSNIDDGQLSDDDTTYNRSSTVSHVDLFTTGNLPTGVTVVGLREHLRARKDDTGAREGRHVLRVNSTNYESASLNLTEAYQTFHNFRSVSPDTSTTWTESEVNALEAGYKVQS